MSNDKAQDVNALKNQSLNQWQTKMLPLMKQMVVGLTLFFFIASCVQLYSLHRSIENSPKLDVEKFITHSHSGKASPSLKFTHEDLQNYSLILLENNALERRHHQANVLLMSRVWVRYLGFVTGIILSMVGGIFILGKLQEPVTELNTQTDKITFALKSGSPGIILAVLGVILMLATILTHHEITVNDVAVYTNGIHSNQAPLLD